MIRVLCPSCGRRFRTERRALGVTAVCTGCGETFQIGEKLAPFEWQQKDLAEDSWIGVEPPKEEKELKHCFKCEAPMQPEQVICPACGVNQVTGVIHKPEAKLEDHRGSSLSAVPFRLLAVLAVIAVVVMGMYWVISGLARSVVATSEELVAERPIYEAAGRVRDDVDPRLIEAEFTGAITDKNLPNAVSKLAVKNEAIRRAAVLLIGCGQFNELDLLIDGLKEIDNTDLQQEVLEAVGPRRLLSLSMSDDPEVRHAAATALAMLFDVSDEELRELLAETTSYEQKLEALNDYCRAYPLLTGQFEIRIAETTSPFEVEVQQYGDIFYLLVAETEFRSNHQREFSILVEHWSAATSPVVDLREVARFLDGEIALSGKDGAKWSGTVKLSTERDLPDDLPGFLPFEAPPTARPVEKTIRLVRPEK
jgi:uncharacterized Zn finger protein (UPF0148 family)